MDAVSAVLSTTPRSHWIDVPGGHRLHVAELGAPHGLPVLLLHGGPGSGASPVLWQGFDLARWRLIVPDQRGAGRSTPRGGVAHNSTADLLADLRRLRQAFGVGRWLVVGGSWGAALALAHALDQPAAVSGLLLRSAFLARAEDVARFFAPPGGGLQPAWERLRDTVGHDTLLPALHQSLHGGDTGAAARAARAWWAWECAQAGAAAGAERLDGAALQRQVDRLRVQSHYLVNACWLDAPSLPERCAALGALAALLLHGRQDRICPPEGAALLHARLPGSRLRWVDDAGHDPTHPALAAATAQALREWAAEGRWS